MTIKNKCLPLFFLLVLAVANTSIAQNFRVKAALAAVPASGFYKIPITTQLSAYANATFSDIRITSDGKTFVPYINQKETIKTLAEQFKECTILSNKEEGKYTVVVLENPYTEGLRNISLILNNTTVERLVSISGSDDKEKWYIIGDSVKFHRSMVNRVGSYTQTLVLPLSKYPYFRLKIDNAGSDPLKINRVGTLAIDDTLATAGVLYNPIPAFTHKDSNKVTYVVIKNALPFVANKIYMHIAAPPFFNRVVTAYVMHNDKDSSNLMQPVGSATISPGIASFAISSQKALTILLAISNEDNPPLTISGITTSQEEQYLICWLEKGIAYTLLAGNDQVTAPVYDLSVFKSKIPENVPKLTYGPLQVQDVATPASTATRKNYWLWPAIILSVIALSVLTYRLMKDVGNTSNDM